MKRRTKRIFALILALCVMATMVVLPMTASAASDGSITLTSQAGDTIVGRSFKIYKIFNATTTTSGSSVSYQWYEVSGKNIYYDFFYTTWNDGTDNHSPYMGTEVSDGSGSIQAVVNKLKSLTDAELSFFAHDLYEYIVAMSIDTTVAEFEADVDPYTVNNLDYGYYLIYDSTADLGTGLSAIVRSAVMLTSVSPSADVTIKADMPAISKVIADINDDAKGSTVASATIGDVITFQIDVEVPDTTGYNSGEYTYVVTDTLPYTLTYNDSLTVKRNDTAITNYSENTQQSATDEYVYTIKSDNVDIEGNYYTTIAINFVDVTAYTAGDKLTITFDAILNNDAVQENTNTATLQYSNDPSDLTSTNTIEDIATVYCYDLQIKKINTSREALAGAEFELYRYDSNSGDWVIITFVENTVDMSSYGGSSTATVYRVYDAVTDPNASATTTTTTLKVNDDGYLYIEGLGSTIDSNQFVEGYYQLIETVAPDGYQLPTEEFYFTLYTGYNATTNEIDTMAIRNVSPYGNPNTLVAGIYDAGGSISGGTSTGVDYNDDDYYSFEVINLAGTELPSTGGMGTGIFIVGGILLMVCAGAALVLINRKGKNSNV